MPTPTFSRQATLYALVLVIVCATATTGAVGLADTNAKTTPTQQPETDNTVTRIDLHENGSATWTIEIRTRLESQDEKEAYESYQEDFRANKSQHVNQFAQQINGVVANAENETGREMTASSFSASTSVESLPQDWGVVTYTFHWSNFAETSENKLMMGDVFVGGYFLSSSDSMTVSAPEGYEFESASPDADSQGDETITWSGQRDFADGKPAVTLTASSSAASTTQPSESTPSDDSGTSNLWFGVVGIVLVAAGAVYQYRYRDSDSSDTDDLAAGTPSGSDSPDDDDGGQSVSSAVDEDAGETLLSDDERVLEAVSENGGRMKQKAIAETLDWSSSKTSRVLQQMEENDQIRRLQVGRENLVDLDTDSEFVD